MNCVFARRRYADGGIPIVIMGANGFASTLYVTINGVNYTGNTTSSTYGYEETAAKVGDTISIQLPDNTGTGQFRFYVDSVEQSQTNHQATWTIPQGVKKLYISLNSTSQQGTNQYRKQRGVNIVTSDEYLLVLYVGSGQASTHYVTFDGGTTKITQAMVYVYPTATNAKYAMKGSAAHPSTLTINGALIGTSNADTTLSWTRSMTGVGAIAISAQTYSSTRDGYFIVNTFS